MKLTLSILLLCSTCHALTINDYLVAIERAENDPKRLYGVRLPSVKTHDAAYRTAWITIYHAKQTFRGGDFVHHLAGIWAPLDDPKDVRGLNRNWERNVRYFLTHPK